MLKCDKKLNEGYAILCRMKNKMALKFVNGKHVDEKYAITYYDEKYALTQIETGLKVNSYNSYSEAMEKCKTDIDRVETYCLNNRKMFEAQKELFNKMLRKCYAK